MPQVFDRLAADMLLGTLEGINATIFAYGQTGSGKTFTITGGPERYANRGLIPRSISFLFQNIAQRPTFLYKVPHPLHLILCMYTLPLTDAGSLQHGRWSRSHTY